jgi:endonuclease/exonuclease/phosphatase family metal-dependent hydrolase
MKLLSWNIQWGRGADGRVDLDRIVAHARRFADFDVLCVQEVSAGYPELPGSDGSDQFTGLAERLPGYIPVQAAAIDLPNLSAPHRRFGNMLISRLPVGLVLRHLLPWPVDTDVPSMQRVALEATLETTIGALRVTTTHLEWYSPLQRAAQAERLRELHQEAWAHATTPRRSERGPFDAVRRGGPAVLMGDFNFRPDAPERARLQDPLEGAVPPYRDAWALLHPGVPHPASVGVHDKKQWPEPAFTLDFAFVSEDLAPRVVDVRVDQVSDASDHQPLLLELDLRP